MHSNKSGYSTQIVFLLWLVHDNLIKSFLANVKYTISFGSPKSKKEYQKRR